MGYLRQSTVNHRTLDSRHNGLNALRLLLALVVIVSHAPRPLGSPSPAIGDFELGGWAVAGFFAISGWLVTSSRLRLPLGRFLWHRSLRIFPGYWVCLVIVAFLLAPIAALSSGGQWQPVEAIGYVVQNLSLHVLQPGISTSLVATAEPHVWNLSLWTLEIEFLCYFGVGLALCWSFVRRRPWLTMVALAGVVTANAFATWMHVGGDLTQGILRLGSFFVAGAAIYRTQIPLRARWAAGCLALLVLLVLLGQVRTLGAIPLAYLTLWTGAVLPLRGWRTDLSYGVYVYAFPVQQVLAIVGGARWGIAWYVTFTVMTVLLFAWLSWAFVERPMLRLKSVTLPSSWRRWRDPSIVHLNPDKF